MLSTAAASPVLVFVAYLLGSIPFGLMLTKLLGGKDVREHGSGNIGATNVSRVAGPLAGILTLLLDALKGAAAVGLVNGVIIAKLKVPAFIVTLGTSFIVRGVAYLMSENTTVIGLPAGIRAYGNDALIYYIGGEGGGLYLLHRPEVGGEMLAIEGVLELARRAEEVAHGG